MTAMKNLKNWQVEADSENIVWAYFDRAGAAVNSIDKASFSELETIIENLNHNTPYKGLVIGSAKKIGFIAGADVTQFTAIEKIEQAADIIAQGQNILDKLAALNIPTVAMIKGFCLGGGLELALGCRYRITDDGASTKLGLPEVKLGIQPGWGGSVRLPRLIGPMKTFPLMLTGRAISGRAAKKIGFVDAVVPERQLKNAARNYILQKPKVKRASLFARLSNLKMSRLLLAKIIINQLAGKAKRVHYPAP
jgi:3-hydroxyacyl-CoA dehydrogenase/enoyl-CoA hydratase/3-hydroxybutyryl-CoA epimerase